jgi:hypothetical protein
MIIVGIIIFIGSSSTGIKISVGIMPNMVIPDMLNISAAAGDGSAGT